MNILCIYRAKEYSPNMVDKDKAILDEVASVLREKGHEVMCLSEDTIAEARNYTSEDVSVIFSMARRPETLSWLKKMQGRRVIVINTPESVEMASRKGLLFPEDDMDTYPLWVKKAEGYSQSQDDVIYVEDEEGLETALEKFRARGITKVFRSHHIEGDLVKFYGIRGTDFFEWRYMSESFSKFGWEERNRAVYKYTFSLTDLKADAETLARKTGLDVYGGDCIVREDGTFTIIDINDWPSFSSCRESAAKAIVADMENLIQSANDEKDHDRVLASTFKSADTEEWLDVVFTRKVGYRFARFFERLGVHPNTVTVISMFLGALSGVFFFFRADSPQGLIYNVIGILLLMTANFLDSADGQLARMTGKKTRLGRILDGAAGDVWFISIYFALCCRLFHQNIPFTTMEWEWAAFAVAAVSSLYCHAHQCGLADYYRNIHLFFASGKSASELDSSVQQREICRNAKWRDDPVWKFFLILYVNYTKGQERQTPQFQQLMRVLNERYGKSIPASFRARFREKSLPLMKWANILTFNTRAIVLYVCCVMDVPWLYWAFEIFVMTSLYFYMRHTHETFCKEMTEKLEDYG